MPTDKIDAILNDSDSFEGLKDYLKNLNDFEQNKYTLEDLYQKQLEKKELAKQRVKYFILTFHTTEDIVQSIIDDIKRFNYDEELFEYYQEELHKYTDENAKHIGRPEYKRYLDMVVADNTWMYVLMNPDQISLYPEYQQINEKYNIYTSYSAAYGWR